MVDARNRQMIGVVIASYMQTKDAREHEVLLETLDTLLKGSGIRVYVNPDWRVYVDEDKRDHIPKALSHAAHYIEAVRPDGTAHVLKGGIGPRELSWSTEPKPRTILDILLDEKDLV